MGVFVQLFRSSPKKWENHPQFIEQVSKLVTEGGLFNLKTERFNQYEFFLLEKPRFSKWMDRGDLVDVLAANYSWFENYRFERMYVCKQWNEAVDTGKVGDTKFARTVLALHLLEGLHSDYSKWAAIEEAGETEVYRALRWIFTNLDDVPQKPFLSFWLLYEQFKDGFDKIGTTYFMEFSWQAAVTIPGHDIEMILEYFQAYAVENGTENALKESQEFEKKYWTDEFLYPYKPLRQVNDGLEKIFGNTEFDQNTIFDAIMNTMQFNCLSASKRMAPDQADPFEDMDTESLFQSLETMHNIADHDVYTSTFYTGFSELPVFVLAKSCELTGRDFWTEYPNYPWIRTYYARKTDVAMKEILNQPISTEEFFYIDSDEMLIHWRKDSPLLLSDEMEEWFTQLSERYHELVSELSEHPQEKPLHRICSIISSVQKIDRRAIPFESFFEETIAHVTDPAWIAYWILFEELAELWKEDHPDDEERPSLYFDVDYRLRDFMTITANPELRDYVFSKERIEAPKD